MKRPSPPTQEWWDSLTIEEAADDIRDRMILYASEDLFDTLKPHELWLRDLFLQHHPVD